MGVGTRGSIGKEDFIFHDPASGSADQTYNRTDSDGVGTTPVTKHSALDIPIRDAAVVSGANTPFEVLVDTQVAKNVETALADIRKNTTHMKNFEHYGAIPGVGISAANAIKNTEVFNKILTDIGTSGRTNGVFFPGSQYEFAESGGLMPTVTSKVNLAFCGTGNGTILKQHSSSVANATLLQFTDCSGITAIDMKLQKASSAAGACLAFGTTGAAFTDITVDKLALDNGAQGLSIDGGAGGLNRGWISRLFVTLSGTNAVQIADSMSNLYLLNNIILATGAAGNIRLTTGDLPLQDVWIAGNSLSGSVHQDITVIRSGVYSSSTNARLYIHRNGIGNGGIYVEGMNEPDVSFNKMTGGGIAVVLTNGMTTAQRLKMIGNTAVGGNGAYLDTYLIDGQGCELQGFTVESNDSINSTRSGFRFSGLTSALKYGSVSKNLVLNASRHDADATDYSDMRLEGTGGVRESIFENNILRCTAATGLGNKPLYGIEEVAASGCDLNFIGPNYIKGYTTADVLITGANSVDVVARYAALDTAAAGRLGSYDQGAAV